MSIEQSVPRCRKTSKASCGSFIPKSACRRTRWPELDIGKNSVSPWTDADSLIRALRRLRGLTPEERAALGARARRVVEERYAMPAIARRHLALYEAVARRRNGG